MCEFKTIQEEENNNFSNDGAESIDLSNINDETNSTYGGDASSDIKSKKKDEDESIAKEETSIVLKLKFLVIGVLVFSAIGVAVAVYSYISTNERKDFEVQFHDDATKVLDAIGHSFDLTLGAIDAFAVSMVSLAAYTNQQWPFVVIPDFSIRAQKIRILSNAILVSLFPLVSTEERKEYEKFTAKHSGWVMDSIAKQEADVDYTGPIIYNYTAWNVIHYTDEYSKENPGEEGTNETGPYLPSWQISPVVPRYAPYNWNLLGDLDPEIFSALSRTHKACLLPASLIAEPGDNEFDWEADYFSDFVASGEEAKEPLSEIYYPILDVAIDTLNLQDSKYFTYREELDHTKENEMDSNVDKLRGLLSVTIYWRDMIRDTLPEGSNGIIVVFENECSPSFSYQINGPKVTYLGKGDKHDAKYDYLELSSFLLKRRKFASSDDRRYNGIPVMDDFCPFHVRLYPSDVMLDDFVTSNRITFTVSAILIFFFTSTVFLLYDFMVERRQKKVMKSAVRSNKIVSSLFPSTVRDQLYPAVVDFAGDDNDEEEGWGASPKKRLQSYLNNNREFRSNDAQRKTPIAELFPDTTVFFADIAGFTAWSSIREPTQVFHLLEVLYGAFDAAARRRSVFKVETIGDCYVAVTGLPGPQKKHAVIMVKFAAECRNLMIRHTHELERTLGPGTGNLRLRLGLHSGPTTAGVLRGEKCRFQLFGDTVNTAARMESLGQRDRIHASRKTADLLINAGKRHWIMKREEIIDAKGKGHMQTYWVEPKGDYSASIMSDSSQSTYPSPVTNPGQLNAFSNLIDYASKESTSVVDIDCLVDYNVTVLQELLQNIMSQRTSNVSLTLYKGSSHVEIVPDWDKAGSLVGTDTPSNSTIRDEVLECISLPEFDESKKVSPSKRPDATLDPSAKAQLRGFIYDIARNYRSNAFHNFEHACHVTMSTKKLLQRVVTPDISVARCTRTVVVTNKDVHDYTFGITSDPLTQFAIVLAALIHDVDHPGVSNGQLVKEKADVALKYKNKSVAEQNSIDFAWKLLMDPKNSDLLACIYSNEMELKRFRNLLVNTVMATDIFDKELKEQRESRWEKAFHPSEGLNNMEKLGRCEGKTNSAPQQNVDSNRKATIVIEHIIQASDVAHTMQHWKIYQKWNKCLFNEMYAAYKMGRSEKDPSIGWYEGELCFFDNYIIPLAKKLKECGVFGVSCEEFLDFAQDNRVEWESKGRRLVEEMKLELEDDSVQQ